LESGVGDGGGFRKQEKGFRRVRTGSTRVQQGPPLGEPEDEGLERRKRDCIVEEGLERPHQALSNPTLPALSLPDTLWMSWRRWWLDDSPPSSTKSSRPQAPAPMCSSPSKKGSCSRSGEAACMHPCIAPHEHACMHALEETSLSFSPPCQSRHRCIPHAPISEHACMRARTHLTTLTPPTSLLRPHSP
jgi:hypothetical protein